jgi:retron-type reverse transcriptase
MYKRLISYIEKQNILSKHQYGFRKDRSTEHAIIELTDKISKAIDEGNTQSVFPPIYLRLLTQLTMKFF